MSEPFSDDLARILIRKNIQKGGVTTYSKHALKEMTNDCLTFADVAHVLRAGRITARPEYKNGTWRYRMETQKICVMVAFRFESEPEVDVDADSDAEIVIVTVWRFKNHEKLPAMRR